MPTPDELATRIEAASGSKRCHACGQSLEGSPFAGLDWADFGLQVRVTMARQNVSYRQLADLVGSDQATVHRVAKHGKPIRVETYLALSRWIEAAALRAKGTDHVE
ncbi:MAG: hypothetical protein ACRCYS_16555 [Beijerinckiaceae bacterium]